MEEEGNGCIWKLILRVIVKNEGNPVARNMRIRDDQNSGREQSKKRSRVKTRRGGRKGRERESGSWHEVGRELMVESHTWILV